MTELRFKVLSYKFKISPERLIAAFVFAVLGLIALQIPFSNLAGSKVNFTLFDLFAPVSGAFLGGPLGVFVVLLMQLVNIALHGFHIMDKGVVIRLLPILFGVWFFAKRDRFSLLIPLLAIVSFNLNPIGRSVWYFSLFWLIPYAMYPIVKKSLVARSLASVFIAHSVGGAIWIWAFSLPAVVWKGLVPVVALERSIMALGICASYVLVNNLVVILRSKNFSVKSIVVDKKYLWR